MRRVLDDAEVRALRDAGLTQREIAERLGVTRSAVSKALHRERYREKNRADSERRRDAIRQWARDHSGPCADCGAPTHHPHSKRCPACHQEQLRREAIERCKLFISLRRSGLKNVEIAERCGVPPYVVTTALYQAQHKYGLDVPPSPWFKQVAA